MIPFDNYTRIIIKVYYYYHSLLFPFFSFHNYPISVIFSFPFFSLILKMESDSPTYLYLPPALIYPSNCTILT
eukprot:UN09485